MSLPEPARNPHTGQRAGGDQQHAKQRHLTEQPGLCALWQTIVAQRQQPQPVYQQGLYRPVQRSHLWPAGRDKPQPLRASRYYDSVSGVFLSADTVAGNPFGMNPYGDMGVSASSWDAVLQYFYPGDMIHNRSLCLT